MRGALSLVPPSPLTCGGRGDRSLSGELCWAVIGRITTQHLQSRTSLHTRTRYRNVRAISVRSLSTESFTRQKRQWRVTSCISASGRCPRESISVDSLNTGLDRSFRYHSLTLSRLIDDRRINNGRKGAHERPLPDAALYMRMPQGRKVGAFLCRGIQAHIHRCGKKSER